MFRAILKNECAWLLSGPEKEPSSETDSATEHMGNCQMASKNDSQAPHDSISLFCVMITNHTNSHGARRSRPSSRQLV